MHLSIFFKSKLMAYLFIFSANLNMLFVFKLLQPLFSHFPDKRDYAVRISFTGQLIPATAPPIDTMSLFDWVDHSAIW